MQADKLQMAVSGWVNYFISQQAGTEQVMDFPRKPRHCNSITVPSPVIVPRALQTGPFSPLCLFPHPQINPDCGQSAALVAPLQFSCQHASSGAVSWIIHGYDPSFMCCWLGDGWKRCITAGLPGGISENLPSFVGGRKKLKSFVNGRKSLGIYGTWKGRREGREWGEEGEYDMVVF